MTSLRTWFIQFSRLILVLVVTSACQRGTLSAQGLTPDPYNIVGEYNGQYAPYMYAVEPAPGNVYPNSNRMRDSSTGRGTNGFQSFVDSLDGAEPEEVMPGSSLRRPGIGTPYYRAYRKFDQDYGRLYRPNETADRSYVNNQSQLNTKYFDAMKEPNPRKRAQLLREYNMENLRTSRSFSSLRSSSVRDKSRVAPKPSGSRILDSGSESVIGRPTTRAGVRRPGASDLDPPSLRTRSASPLLREEMGGATGRSRQGANRRAVGLGTTDPGLESPGDLLDRSEEFEPGRTPAPRLPGRRPSSR